MKPGSIIIFLESLTGHIFKALPLFEKEQEGHKVNVNEYLKGIVQEMIGACETFPELGDEPEYLSAINKMQYLSKYELTHDQYRSAIFSSLTSINHLKLKVGEDNAE